MDVMQIVWKRRWVNMFLDDTFFGSEKTLKYIYLRDICVVVTCEICGVCSVCSICGMCPTCDICIVPAMCAMCDVRAM